MASEDINQANEPVPEEQFSKNQIETMMNAQERKKISGYGPGDVCLITGLHTGTQFNNKSGFIGKFFEESGRYEVKLGAPFRRSIKVKVDNLNPAYMVIADNHLSHVNKQIAEMQRETYNGIMNNQRGLAERNYESICNLLEENNMTELNSDYYWHIKDCLLTHRTCADFTRFGFAEFKSQCFEILEGARCPHVQIKTLITYTGAAFHSYDPPTEEIEEAIDMLQERLDSHYGYLSRIVYNLTMLYDMCKNYETATSILDEYIPICEALPIIQLPYMLRLAHAQVYIECIEYDSYNKDKINKGKKLVKNMNSAWEDHKLQIQHRNRNPEPTKLCLEGKMLLVEIRPSNSPIQGTSLIEKAEMALHHFEQAGRKTSTLEGQHHKWMSGVFSGVSECCIFLGDKKNAQKFWRKYSRKNIAPEWMTQKIETMVHTRTLNISFGKEILCARPGCDNVGPVKLCMKCKSVKYCSRKCQRAHHKVHKKNCKKSKSPFQ